MNDDDKQTALMHGLANSARNYQAQAAVANIGHYWFEPYRQQQWTPWSITYTNVASSPEIHHLPGNVKPGTTAPCGVPLAEKKGDSGDWAVTGNQASTDVDKVTCLKCLRELARGK